MIGMSKYSPITIETKPETLAGDLRERARLGQLLAHSRAGRIDALYMQAAANEIDRLNKLLAERPLITLPDDFGEPEDFWPRCDHGEPIPPGCSPIERCPVCRTNAYLHR
jgi:hypothetical protein